MNKWADKAKGVSPVARLWILLALVGIISALGIGMWIYGLVTDGEDEAEDDQSATASVWVDGPPVSSELQSSRFPGNFGAPFQAS